MLKANYGYIVQQRNINFKNRTIYAYTIFIIYFSLHYYIFELKSATYVSWEKVVDQYISIYCINQLIELKYY